MLEQVADCIVCNHLTMVNECGFIAFMHQKGWSLSDYYSGEGIELVILSDKELTIDENF